MTTTGRQRLDPPSSLVGQLQRGLGSGYLAALSASRRVVARYVVRLTIEDPRWDCQLDSRADYYGRLALWSGLPFDALRRHLKRNDDASRQTGRASLVIGVLGAMARHGDSGAVDTLRAYVHTGTWWDEALHELGRTGRPETWSGLDHVLHSRFSDETLEDELWKAYGEPLTSWAAGDGPLVRPLTRIRRQTRRQLWRAPNVTGLSTAELLALNPTDYRTTRSVLKVLERRTQSGDRAALHAAMRNEDPWLASLAAVALSRQGDATIVSRGEELLRKGRYRGKHVVRGRIYRALEALPAEATLPLARVWRSSRAYPLRVAADRLLTQHATAEDLPWTRRQLRLRVTDRRVYRVCNALKMLVRIGSYGPFSEIVPVYRSFPYSYGRRFAVDAMRATDPEFPATLAFEALWDCEPEIRELAAVSVGDTLPGARERLTELAGDSQEDEEVRKAAQARIARQPGDPVPARVEQARRRFYEPTDEEARRG